MRAVPGERYMIKLICKLKILLFLLAALTLASCASPAPVRQVSADKSLPASPAATQIADPDYLINSGDILEVSVWKEEDMEREVLVLPDGTFSFPLVGFIKAAGLTPADVQGTLTERIKRFIPYPVVTVSVKEVAGNSVYVLGYVAKPGEYTAGRQLDVLQALSLAGGLTVQANERNIMIIRRENGRQNIYPFNFTHNIL